VYNYLMQKLNAKQLRILENGTVDTSHLKKHEIYIILDDVLDTYNIGSVFRLADAIAAKKVLLCRGSVTPPNHRIKKASINTTEIVEWEYFEDTKDAIKKLRTDVPGIQIVAVELDVRSVSYENFDYHLPIAVIVGHETTGVSEDVLDLCDAIVELPMFGINISMNVMVSLAIVLFQVIENQRLTQVEA
jgi:23S rRNA (guanosine2251-2'-O)-methyltransferase